MNADDHGSIYTVHLLQGQTQAAMRLQSHRKTCGKWTWRLLMVRKPIRSSALSYVAKDECSDLNALARWG